MWVDITTIDHIIIPGDHEKLEFALSEAEQEKKDEVVVRIHNVQDKDGALLLTIVGDKTETVVKTKGLTGNKELVNEFIEYLYRPNIFGEVFCVPEQEAKKDSYRVPNNLYNSLIKYEGDIFYYILDDFKDILDEKSKKHLEELLKNDEDKSLSTLYYAKNNNMESNQLIKGLDENNIVSIRLIKVLNDGRLKFSVGINNCILTTKFSTTDTSKIDSFCNYIKMEPTDEYNALGEFDKVFFSIDGVGEQQQHNKRLSLCIGKQIEMSIGELKSIVHAISSENLKRQFLDTGVAAEDIEKPVNVLVVGTAGPNNTNVINALALVIIGARIENAVFTKSLTGNKKLVNNFFKYFEEDSKEYKGTLY